IWLCKMSLLVEKPLYHCSVCEKCYKTKDGLKQHYTIVKGYNKNPPGIYKLSLKASIELKKIFIKIIQDRLKAHFTCSGSQRVLMPCDNAYSLLSQILNDEQWGVKYFANEQRTYITFQPPRERAPGSIRKEIKPKIKQV
ncbi:1544_t:CDS:2, partial [Cetraspora pellucida]